MPACPMCGLPFEQPARPRPPRAYCSAKCATGAENLRRAFRVLRGLPPRACDECGGPLEGHGSRKFCSEECKRHAEREVRRLTGPPLSRRGACSECGKAVTVAATSAPPERRRCRDCQRKNPRRRSAPFVPQDLTCPTCGTSFTQQRYGQKYCCTEHRPPRPGTRTAGRVAASRRRRLRVATTWDGVTDAEIFDRDRWKCGICGKRIGKSFKAPHPRSKSIDHVIPLSEGGDDTAANKRAAHLGCNIQRSNRGGNEQLALIG